MSRNLEFVFIPSIHCAIFLALDGKGLVLKKASISSAFDSVLKPPAQLIIQASIKLGLPFLHLPRSWLCSLLDSVKVSLLIDPHQLHVLHNCLPGVEHLVVRGQEAQIVWDPVAVLADVEVIGLAALGLRDIGTALIVEGNSDRVRDREVGSPFGELQRFGVGFLSAEGLEKKSGEKEIGKRAFHGKEFRKLLSEFSITATLT